MFPSFDSCQFADTIALPELHKLCISPFRRHAAQAAAPLSQIDDRALQLEVYLFVGTQAAGGRVLTGGQCRVRQGRGVKSVFCLMGWY